MSAHLWVLSTAPLRWAQVCMLSVLTSRQGSFIMEASKSRSPGHLESSVLWDANTRARGDALQVQLGTGLRIHLTLRHFNSGSSPTCGALQNQGLALWVPTHTATGPVQTRTITMEDWIPCLVPRAAPQPRPPQRPWRCSLPAQVPFERVFIGQQGQPSER